MNHTDRYKFILDYFEKNNPDAKTELTYESPFQLLVAVILSAQCTDKRVNETTPAFFQRFNTVFELAIADIDEVYQYIKSISYPNNKSRHLIGMAQMLVNNFGAEVPSEIDQLIQLPGVGRKTANVIASVVFNKPAMAVDTHVFRVANRLGLTKNSKNPLETEMHLVKHIPKYMISKAHHWLILHGRYVCKARKPNCEVCNLKKWCNYYELQFTEK